MAFRLYARRALRDDRLRKWLASLTTRTMKENQNLNIFRCGLISRMINTSAAPLAISLIIFEFLADANIRCTPHGLSESARVCCHNTQ